MNKLLVITGASRGIGLCTAKRFKSQGYRIINLSRSAIDADIGEQLSVDLANPGWVKEYGCTLLESAGQPDSICLIHNASVLLKDSIQNASSEMARVLQINLIASQQLNELLLPLMKTGSSVLYVGSTLSEKAVAGTLTYATSKHAVLGLMRASCQDLMGTGIHTAAVCPGFTNTEMLRDHLGQDQEILQAIASGNGFNRLIEPTEIAESLWFCARSPVLNGAVIHANLGQVEH